MALTAIRKQGDQAENKACQYLLDSGLILVEKNYNCKLGEIDLIMKDRDTLVFIEVRYRKNTNFGGAALSVTKSKQDKLVRAANHYLLKARHVPACRFDVVAIENTTVNWIQNAIDGFG